MKDIEKNNKKREGDKEEKKAKNESFLNPPTVLLQKCLR